MIDIYCGRGDLAIARDDLAPEDTLETAVMLSLFTDARDDASGARGWWGDCVADNPGDRFGSLLWTLDRATKGPQTLRLAEGYARDALAWLVADKAATQVSVTATYLPGGSAQGIALEVKVTEPGGLTKTFNFAMASGTWL